MSTQQQGEDLTAKVAALESVVRSQDAIIQQQSETIDRLRRRKPPRVLDAKASDKFSRPPVFR